MLTRLALLSMLTLSVAAGRAQAEPAKVAGQWNISLEIGSITGRPTIELKQDGEKLTGHYSGQLGEAELTGSIKGNAFSFSFSGDAQGQQFKVTYTGTVEKDTMKGTLDLAGMATGTFTGKKQS